MTLLRDPLRIAVIAGMILATGGVAECRPFPLGKKHHGKQQVVLVNGYLVGTPVVAQAPVAYTTGSAPVAYYVTGSAPQVFPYGSAPVAGAAPTSYVYSSYAAAPAANASGAAPGVGAAPTSASSVAAHIRLDGVSIVTVNGRTTVTASNGASRTINGAIQSWSSENNEVTITTTDETLVFDGRDFVSGEGAGDNRGVSGILDPSQRTEIVEELREIYRDEIRDYPVAERTRELNARARALVAATLDGKEVEELSSSEKRLADSLATRARSRAGSY